MLRNRFKYISQSLVVASKMTTRLCSSVTNVLCKCFHHRFQFIGVVKEILWILFFLKSVFLMVVIGLVILSSIYDVIYTIRDGK